MRFGPLGELPTNKPTSCHDVTRDALVASCGGAQRQYATGAAAVGCCAFATPSSMEPYASDKLGQSSVDLL